MIKRRFFWGLAAACPVGLMVVGSALAWIGCAKKVRRQSVVLEVRKMTCGSCVQAVTAALMSVSGVVSAKVTLKPGRAVVVYDAEKTGVKALIRATTEIGYPSSVLSGPGPP